MVSASHVITDVYVCIAGGDDYGIIGRSYDYKFIKRKGHIPFSLTFFSELNVLVIWRSRKLIPLGNPASQEFRRTSSTCFRVVAIL